MPPRFTRTIHELLVAQADALGDAPAIIVQDRSALSYDGLRKEVERTVDALATAGIGRGSRVALALPNEPEAATLTLSVLCGAICVPVNPVYGATTCESLLRSLHVDALIAPGVDPPAWRSRVRLASPCCAPHQRRRARPARWRSSEARPAGIIAAT
jgi:acyl-CoA synthetase (AMP-forming)/AMP-acid ligase II